MFTMESTYIYYCTLLNYINTSYQYLYRIELLSQYQKEFFYNIGNNILLKVRFLFYFICSTFTNFEIVNKSSYCMFFDSIFTYKKEFTLKYTMIDTQKESIYSRLHFFQRHLRGTMNGDKHFIFSNIITY